MAARRGGAQRRQVGELHRAQWARAAGDAKGSHLGHGSRLRRQGRAARHGHAARRPDRGCARPSPRRWRPSACVTGTKACVAHTEPGAGLVGLVSAATRTAPPNAELRVLNAHVDLQQRQACTQPAATQNPSSVGVTSLGINGTIGHLVLGRSDGGASSASVPSRVWRRRCFRWRGTDEDEDDHEEDAPSDVELEDEPACVGAVATANVTQEGAADDACLCLVREGALKMEEALASSASRTEGPLVRYAWDDEADLAIVTMSDERRANALSLSLSDDLVAAAQQAARAGARGVVLQGAGAHFCVGGGVDERMARALSARRWCCQRRVPVRARL